MSIHKKQQFPWSPFIIYQANFVLASEKLHDLTDINLCTHIFYFLLGMDPHVGTVPNNSYRFWADLVIDGHV